MKLLIKIRGPPSIIEIPESMGVLVSTATWLSTNLFCMTDCHVESVESPVASVILLKFKGGFSTSFPTEIPVGETSP